MVIDAVEDMIEVLQQAESVDIDQRDWCKANTFSKETEKLRHDYKIEETAAKLEKLNRKTEELEHPIVATDAEIQATQTKVQAIESRLRRGDR